MGKNLRDAAWALGVLGAYAAVVTAVAFVVTIMLHGCALFQHKDPMAAAYAAERLNCVQKSETADMARVCFQIVDEKYAHLKDAGR